MSEATKLEAGRTLGHRLRPAGPGPDAVAREPLSADMVLDGPLPRQRWAGSHVSPALAVVLGADLPAGTSPEAVHLATRGAFLALELHGGDGGGGVVLAERLLPRALDGSLRLYLQGRLLQETPLEALGRPAGRLAWLADQVGGLRAGELVLLGTAGSLEARSGTVELWGPLGSTLTTALIEDES